MENVMMLMDVVRDTVVDGPGFRTAVYAAGCKHACPGCHNPQSWEMRNGYPAKVEDVAGQLLSDPFADITFSGGDPLMQVEVFTRLACHIKTRSRKSIWCYTGYRYEEVLRSPRLSAILPYIDVLVDGRFMQGLRDPELFFRGSSNQRLVDVKTSLAAGKVCSYRYEPRLIGI